MGKLLQSGTSQGTMRSCSPAILIAPNAFKGSLTAFEAAQCIMRGFKRALPDARYILAPMADGGDGTMPVIARALKCRLKRVRVRGPTGSIVTARFAVTPKGELAVLEMAEAAGLRLLLGQRLNPMQAGTFGVGELLLSAKRQKCRQLVIGVGGSATVDAGLGMAEAIGYVLFDKLGRRLPGNGAALEKLHAIEGWQIRQVWQKLDMQVAVDVQNPLLGDHGAARVFGPQKGATPAMVRRLEGGMTRFAEIVQRDLGLDVSRLPGAGAAGGLAAGLAAFCGANIMSGFELVADIVELRRKMRQADLVITGEGILDSQSLYGKVPVGVARLAQACSIPVLGMAGGLADSSAKPGVFGMDALATVAPRPMSVQEAMSDAATLLTDASERAARMLALGRFILAPQRQLRLAPQRPDDLRLH